MSKDPERNRKTRTKISRSDENISTKGSESSENV